MNEVEAAGNTPLHFAAYQGWIEGAELLLSLGAKPNPSNNAGDRPWHWATYIGNEDFATWMLKVRVISTMLGVVLAATVPMGVTAANWSS